MQSDTSAPSGRLVLRELAKKPRNSFLTVTILAAAIAMAYSPAQAGPVSARAEIRAPVAAVAVGAYSTARITVASGASGYHSATVAAPVTAASLGPGTTASVSIASSSRYAASAVFLPVAAVSTWRSVSVRM